jgi:hypothetical protein
VINDRDSNFLPILSLNSSPFKFDWLYNKQHNSLETDLHLSVNFFNVSIGRWEPFIEKFHFYLNLNQNKTFNKESFQLEIKSPLKVNMTDKLVENAFESNKSWNIINQEYTALEKKQAKD